MKDKTDKQKKWEKFKEAVKKAGKWTVKNLLPVAISIAAGGLGLPAAVGGLTSEIFKKLTDKKIKILIPKEVFQEKLEELCKGDGKIIEYFQEKLEESNEGLKPGEIKMIIEQVMTPVVYEMSRMMSIMKDEKADLQAILAGWLEEQSRLIQDQSGMIQNEFLLTHNQIKEIQNEMLNGFQKMEYKQNEILENIDNMHSKLEFTLINIKDELSEMIQDIFGQSGQTAYDLDTMFDLATIHFSHQTLASNFDQPYNPDLYVRPELFFGSITKYLRDFKDRTKKNTSIFLLLAHLGMGKTWNFAYITQYILNEKNIAFPFFINLKNGLQQQLYAIFKTQNSRDIVEKCQKIKSKTQLPIFLIFDGLDELTSEELRDFLVILREILNKRPDGLCIALSCRIISWVQDQQILDEGYFFEKQVWPHHLCEDWRSRFDIETPISCILGEFSNNDLNVAIERYGLKRDKFPPGLYEICHQPYILRLVSEFVGLHNVYPDPENPKSMGSLFYSDDRDAKKNTIMYRMGIHGNILALFVRIIEAFPSADSELTDKEFQEFANDQYFRPILYSGIILKKWRQMRTVYLINPVYVPLLSHLFSHLSIKDGGKQVDSTKNGSTTQISTNQSDYAKMFQYFLRMADKRRNEKNFTAELEALKEAENIVEKAYDFDLTVQFEKRMDEFEKEKKMREKAAKEAEKNRIVDYKKTKIIKIEMELLMELEKVLEEIPVVTSIEWNTFGVVIENNRVVGLSLYDKGLTSFPEIIGQLSALKSLHLNNNQLTELTETIDRLTTLEKLILYDNKLTKLPDTIGQLTSLIELNLKGNQLTEIPDSIGNLTNLTNLYLEENQLTKLPDSIGQLTALKIFYLSGNDLTAIPETIGNQTALEQLDLEDNLLITLPGNIGQLVTLKKLNLNGNELTTLPESIDQLKALKKLDLDDNRFTALPMTIEKSLKGLEIQGCKIYGYDIKISNNSNMN